MQIFQINFVDLAFIRFAVIDAANNHVCAHRLVPLRALRAGYRHLRLHSANNNPLPVSSLFLYTCSQEEGAESGGPTDNSFGFAATQTTTVQSRTSQQNLNLLSATGTTAACGANTDGDSLNETPAQLSTEDGPTAPNCPVVGAHHVAMTTGSSGSTVIVGSAPRKKIFLLVHNVLPDGKPAILKVGKEMTTVDVIQQALQKQMTASGGGGSSDTSAVGVSSNQWNLNDYALIEDIGSEMPATSQSAGFETLSTRSQRILEATDRPAELQQAWPSSNAGRFILMRISSDPSSRAWFNTIRQRSKTNLTSSLPGGSTGVMCSTSGSQNAVQRPASATCLEIKKSDMASHLDATGSSSYSHMSTLANGTILTSTTALMSDDSHSSFRGLETKQMLEDAGNANRTTSEVTRTSGSSVDFASGARLMPANVSTFTICILNVSCDLPYTILRCPITCCSLDVIGICLQKAHLAAQCNPSDFCLLQELVSSADQDTSAGNTSGNAGNSSGTSLGTGSALSGVSFAGTGSSTGATFETIDGRSHEGYRRVLSDRQNVFEQFSAAQMCWLGRVQFRMHRKRDVCSMPNVLLPDDFVLPIDSPSIDDLTAFDGNGSRSSNRDAPTRASGGSSSVVGAGSCSKPASPESAAFGRRLNKLTKSARGSLRKLNRLGKMSNSLRSKRGSTEGHVSPIALIAPSDSAQSGASGAAGGRHSSASGSGSFEGGAVGERSSHRDLDETVSDYDPESPATTKKRHQSFAGVPAVRNMSKLKQLSLSRFRLWK
jgi:hypothetical protein